VSLCTVEVEPCIEVCKNLNMNLPMDLETSEHAHMCTITAVDIHVLAAYRSADGALVFQAPYGTNKHMTYSDESAVTVKSRREVVQLCSSNTIHLIVCASSCISNKRYIKRRLKNLHYFGL
jgi:hypothetical protein